MVPVGAILPFYGGDNQLPVNYLFCNGDAISRMQFPALYNHLVLANSDLRIDAERARLPDLRGEFLRGWDNQRGIDDRDRRLGSFQEDMLRSHSHVLPGDVRFHVGDGGAFASVDDPKRDTNYRNPQTSETGGRETRPRNVCVNFIIRALP